MLKAWRNCTKLSFELKNRLFSHCFLKHIHFSSAIHVTNIHCQSFKVGLRTTLIQIQNIGPHSENESKKRIFGLLIHTIWPSGHNVCKGNCLYPNLIWHVPMFI